MPPRKQVSFDQLPPPSPNPSPFPPGPIQQHAPTASTSQASSDRDPRPGEYAIDPSLLGEGVGLRRRDQVAAEFRGESPQQESGQAGAGRGPEGNLFDAEGNILVGEAGDANEGRSNTPQAQPNPPLNAALQEVQRLIHNLNISQTSSPDLNRFRNGIAGMTKWSTAAKRTFLLESKEDRKMSKENENWKKDEKNKQNGLGKRDFWVKLIKEQIQPALEENEGADQSDPSWHRVPDCGIFNLFEQNPKDNVSNISVMLGELDQCEKPFWKLFAPSLSPITLRMIVVRTRNACKKGLKLWLGCSTNQVIDMIPHMKTFIKEMTDQGAEVYTWSHLEHGKDKTDHPKDGIVADGKTGKVTWYMFSGNLGTAGMGHEVHWRDEKKRERKVREEILGLECDDEEDESEEEEDVEFPSSFENLGRVVFDARSDNSGLWPLLNSHSRTYEIRRKMKVLVMHTPGFFKRHMKVYSSDRPYEKMKYREQHRQIVKEQKKEQQAEALRDIGEIPAYERHRDSLEIAVFDAVQDDNEKLPPILPFDDPAFEHAQSIASREDHVEARRILDKFERSLEEVCNEDEESAKRRTELLKITREKKIDRKEVEEEENFVKKKRVKDPNQPRNYTSRMPRGRRPSSSNRSSSRPRASSSNPTTSRSGSGPQPPPAHLQALMRGDYDTQILNILQSRENVVERWSDVANHFTSSQIGGHHIEARYPYIANAPPRPFFRYMENFRRNVELAAGVGAASGNIVRGDDTEVEGDGYEDDRGVSEDVEDDADDR